MSLEQRLYSEMGIGKFFKEKIKKAGVGLALLGSVAGGMQGETVYAKENFAQNVPQVIVPDSRFRNPWPYILGMIGNERSIPQGLRMEWVDDPILYKAIAQEYNGGRMFPELFGELNIVNKVILRDNRVTVVKESTYCLEPAAHVLLIKKGWSLPAITKSSNSCIRNLENINPGLLHFSNGLFQLVKKHNYYEAEKELITSLYYTAYGYQDKTALSLAETNANKYLKADITTRKQMIQELWKVFDTMHYKKPKYKIFDPADNMPIEKIKQYANDQNHRLLTAHFNIVVLQTLYWDNLKQKEDFYNIYNFLEPGFKKKFGTKFRASTDTKDNRPYYFSKKLQL
jgi:hypothetical protein